MKTIKLGSLGAAIAVVLLQGCAILGELPGDRCDASTRSGYDLFDPKRAVLMAQASLASYGQSAGAKGAQTAVSSDPREQACVAFTEKSGIEQSPDCAVDGGEGKQFLAALYKISGDEYVLAFRGTASRANVETDLQMFPWRTLVDGTHAHAGFADAWYALRDDVILMLRREKVRNLWLTGHSLGGAEAVVAAAELPMLVPEVKLVGIYTFEAPRVGDVAMAQGIEKRMTDLPDIKVVHNNDAIPVVPPQLLGFYGVGRCVYISAEDDVEACYGLSISEGVKGVLRGIKERRFSAGDILDGGHRMETIVTVMGKVPSHKKLCPVASPD